MKFALISHVLPPGGSGQALLIYHLLKNLSRESYCLITTEPLTTHNGPASTDRLQGSTYWLPQPFRVNRGHRFGLRHPREGINIPLAVRQHARRITEILKQESCEAVVACTGDVTLLPAAYFASRRARIPFYPYILDHYSYREWVEPAGAFWARRFESRVMKQAETVMVLNEFLRDDLRERFGIDAAVIRPSLDLSSFANNGQPAGPSPDSEVKIVYTGQIYEAHYDAFHNLIAAIESLGPRIKLHVYNDRPQSALEENGIRGPVVYHAPLPAKEMPRIHMTADILFLPLAFESPYPKLVKTSAPSKLGEYLAARRPVLVHAPPDSFVSWYCREHDCGVVVDENDPAQLAASIQRILTDAELRQRLSMTAWARARADFDINQSRKAFTELIGLDRGHNR